MFTKDSFKSRMLLLDNFRDWWRSLVFDVLGFWVPKYCCFGKPLIRFEFQTHRLRKVRITFHSSFCRRNLKWLSYKGFVWTWAAGIGIMRSLSCRCFSGMVMFWSVLRQSWVSDMQSAQALDYIPWFVLKKKREVSNLTNVLLEMCCWYQNVNYLCKAASLT